MQNILILADGISAERFIERIAQKRVGDNHYIIVALRPMEREPNPASNLPLSPPFLSPLHLPPH